MTSTRRTLWALMAGQRGRYLAACLILAGGTALTYLSPLVVRAAIDGVLDQGAVGGVGAQSHLSAPARVFGHLRSSGGVGMALFVAAVVAVTITALGSMLVYSKGRLAAQATETIIQRLRQRLYDHLQHVEMAWHDK